MIITIGGTYGSGAKEVAKRAAELLGYQLCDDDIIEQALLGTDEDITENTFRYFDESVGDASLSDLRRLSSSQRRKMSGLVISLTHDVLPLDKRLDAGMRKAINALADRDNVIILGRCADYYLAGRTNLVRTFFINNEEDRIDLIREKFDVSRKEAQKAIAKTDKRRADYYSFFTGNLWRDAANYDLIIHRDYFTIDGCARLLQKVAEIKENEGIAE